MRKAKELIGKSIIHQATGEQVATVHDVVFDADTRKVAALLTHTAGWFQNAKLVPWRNVTSIGDVVLVEGELPVITTADDPAIADDIKPDARISGTAIVSPSGERLGTAGDLFIDDNGVVVGYEVRQGFMSIGNHKFLPAEHVQAVGKDAIITDVPDLGAVRDAASGPSEKGPSAT